MRITESETAVPGRHLPEWGCASDSHGRSHAARRPTSCRAARRRHEARGDHGRPDQTLVAAQTELSVFRRDTGQLSRHTSALASCSRRSNGIDKSSSPNCASPTPKRRTRKRRPLHLRFRLARLPRFKRTPRGMPWARDSLRVRHARQQDRIAIGSAPAAKAAHAA
jgi:hypothetical protein